MADLNLLDIKADKVEQKNLKTTLKRWMFTNHRKRMRGRRSFPWQETHHTHCVFYYIFYILVTALLVE